MKTTLFMTGFGKNYFNFAKLFVLWLFKIMANKCSMNKRVS